MGGGVEDMEMSDEVIGLMSIIRAMKLSVYPLSSC